MLHCSLKTKYLCFSYWSYKSQQLRQLKPRKVWHDLTSFFYIYLYKNQRGANFSRVFSLWWMISRKEAVYVLRPSSGGRDFVGDLRRTLAEGIAIKGWSEFWKRHLRKKGNRVRKKKKKTFRPFLKTLGVIMKSWNP